MMRATFDFRPIIAQGLIAEADTRALLVMACSVNGYLGKVEIGQVNATISWALEPLEKAKEGNDAMNDTMSEAMSQFDNPASSPALKCLAQTTSSGVGHGPARHRVRAVQLLWIQHATP